MTLQGRNAGSSCRRFFLLSSAALWRFFSPLANEEPKAQSSRGTLESASRGWEAEIDALDLKQKRAGPAWTVGEESFLPLHSLCSAALVGTWFLTLSLLSLLPLSYLHPRAKATQALKQIRPIVGNCYFFALYCFLPLSVPLTL